MTKPLEIPPQPPPAAIGPTPQGAGREPDSDGAMVPVIVARAFTAAGVGLRARVLSRLLPSVGPLALAVVGGGV